jgi:hypothetical protein
MLDVTAGPRTWPDDGEAIQAWNRSDSGPARDEVR